jgi:hypothetical protein
MKIKFIYTESDITEVGRDSIQNTAAMDATTLTSPSGPRADSPPSAFSSAFCKTTRSSVTSKSRT